MPTIRSMYLICVLPWILGVSLRIPNQLKLLTPRGAGVSAKDVLSYTDNCYCWSLVVAQ